MYAYSCKCRWDVGTLERWMLQKKAPTSHLYDYTCKCIWDVGTMVRWYVAFVVTYQHIIVPSAFTCISIQIGHWYGTTNAW